MFIIVASAPLSVIFDVQLNFYNQKLVQLSLFELAVWQLLAQQRQQGKT